MNPADQGARLTGSDGKTYPRSYRVNRDAIRQAIEADPTATNTAIARVTSASRDTVIDVRRNMTARAGALVDARYVAMCTAIAECHRVDEVKDLRDKALAFEVYARQAKNTDAERKACAIRLRAERRAGTLLTELAQAELRAMPKTANPTGKTLVVGNDKGSSVATLADLGVTRDQSSKWQKLATIPEREFEDALRDPAKKPSTTALIRDIHNDVAATINRIPEDVLWIWGRVRDFESDGYLSKNPTAIYDAMTDVMQTDVRRIVPAMAGFLCAMLEGASHDGT
ncbi:hypothetical protein F6X37_24060 [Paraburkholderia sp. 31.1]|uniref:hypothetical protein n=1 Tax=Paraburkholderia sp. 31.1 TaxID=2615205 RepID=UPI0016562A8D|nr:hypothetical protein [Paraburkholderia sp. 31.1]MBC8724549.1 hypothetical protein [Paraburkholderia sp. 31.1]